MKYIKWRLKVLMAEREINTAKELQQMMVEIGVGISTNQMARIVASRPDRLTMKIFEGLLTVLDCEPQDLLQVVMDGESDHVPLAIRQKPTAKKSVSKPSKKNEPSKSSNVVKMTDPEGPSFGSVAI